MEEKIINFAAKHPVWFSIALPIVLGILISALIEVFKYIAFGVKPTENDEIEHRKQIDNIFWRISTFVLSLFIALLAVYLLGDFINSWSLKILFILLNSSVPFVFYHLKGKELLKATIGKLFNKFEKTDI